MTSIDRAPGVFWEIVDGQTVLCDVVSGELYKLNSVAAFLWDGCKTTTVEALITRLAAAFPNEDIERLTSDISRFVDSMLAKNLIIVEGRSQDHVRHDY